MDTLELLVSNNCPKCEVFKEALTQYCMSHHQTFNVKLMNTDSDVTLDYARQLGVSSVPTFVYKSKNQQTLGHTFEEFLKTVEVTK